MKHLNHWVHGENRKKTPLGDKVMVVGHPMDAFIAQSIF
jgi:hypothetical protein